MSPDPFPDLGECCPVQYRTLGHTGLRVSALGWGGSPLGGVFGPVDYRDAFRAVQVALDHGINFFDTAPYYGATRAEVMLGRALKGVSRQRYILATKVGRYGADNFDFSATRVTQSVEESLRRLGVDHLDLVQVHDIEFGSVDQIERRTIPALKRLVKTGKVRFVGVSGLPLSLLAEVAVGNDVDVIQTYCHASLFDSSIVEWLPMFDRHRIGCISSAPLGMGLLTDGGPPAWHPAPVELREACARAADFCRSRGTQISQLALHYSANLPGVQTTVVGMAREAELRENLRAVQTPPDPAILDEVKRILAPVQNATWPSGKIQKQPCV